MDKELFKFQFLIMTCLIFLMTASSHGKTAPKDIETCESLQDQFDYYRRLAQQDSEQLHKDLKAKENRKKHKQNAIKMQIREMKEAQKKSREIHQRLEANCNP